MTTVKAGMPVDVMGIIVVEKKRNRYLIEEIDIIGKHIAGSGITIVSFEKAGMVMANMRR